MPFALSLVERLDHLMFEVDDPAWSFRLFTEPLGLPVAFPLEDLGASVRGGVWAGNVTLAFVRHRGMRFGQVLSGPVTPPGTARLTGLAFEPARALPDVLEALQRRGLSSGFVDEDDRWTAALVPGLLDAPEVVFFVAHKGDQGGRRTAAGGVLGVRGVETVRVTSPHPEAWARLLMPTVPEGDRYNLGAGLALQVQDGDKGALADLTLRVASLESAREALKRLDLLGAEEHDGLWLRAERLGGLRLRLVEG